MVKIDYYNESHIKITTEFGIAREISDLFSYFADNYRFHPKVKTKQWDGKIRLFHMGTRLLPYGCIFELVAYCKRSNYPIILDARVKPKAKELTPKFITDFIKNELKCEVVPRDYQIDAVIKAFKTPKSGMLMATSSGKSFVQWVIINLFRYLFPKSTNVLLIVPSISLVEQMKYDFCDYGKNLVGVEDIIHKIYSGADRTLNRYITISTWQSLANMPNEYLSKFDMVLCDEFHGAKAASLSSTLNLCTNSIYRIGMTGSIDEKSNMRTILKSLFGRLFEIIDSKALIDQGHATPLLIETHVIQYPREDVNEYKDLIKSIYAKYTDSDLKPPPAEIYAAENNYIQGNATRLTYISYLVSELKHNKLVLFNNIDYGKKIYDSLVKMGKKVFFITGDMPAKEREEIRLSMENSDDITIVATMQIFSTGINIKRLKYLILAQSIKSRIKIIQSIGRILRQHESKDVAVLIDVVDNITGKNFTYKHGVTRNELYDTEGFDYEILEIDL